jgi:hypothetical protein
VIITIKLLLCEFLGLFTSNTLLVIARSYGFDPPAMKGWINLGLAQIGDGNCEVGRDNCNMSGVIDAWQHQQIPSLYGDLPIQWDTTPGAAKVPGAIFRRGYGLADGWESSLEALVAKDVTPQLGKSLRGVFLGDEICCGNATCWEAGLKPVTQKLRALLGPDAILYTNECANRDITEVPPELDLISVDVYGGYLPGSNGTDEVTAAKAMYDIVFPKLHPHQQVMLVPGTFACGNLSFFPLEAQAQNVVAKLRGYFDWAKADKRVAGFNPWHWETREAAQSGAKNATFILQTIFLPRQARDKCRDNSGEKRGVFRRPAL